MHRALQDVARTDWDGRGPRPLAATVWYPAADGSEETDWSAGPFRFGRSARDAAFADAKKRPLIVLSHGTGGSVGQLSWLAEALAERGFVVAGVNHHGNTAAEDRYRPHGFVLPWERSRDLSVLIDLLMADDAVGPHIDTSRVGATGFSLGGYTVLAVGGARLSPQEWRRRCVEEPSAPDCVLPPEAPFTLDVVDSLALADRPFQEGMARADASTTDARIRAVFAMAPALVASLDTLSLAQIRVPVRVVIGDADEQVPSSSTAATLVRFVPGADVETRKGITHYAFLAPCTWRGRVLVRALCARGGSERTAFHKQVSHAAVQFFEQHLTRVE